MSIDLSALTAVELDQLIAEAAERRANAAPEVSREVPQTAQAIANPQWFVSGQPGGTALQIRHPGVGWLAFFIPHAERTHLACLLLNQALMANLNQQQAGVATTPTAISGGGGRLH